MNILSSNAALRVQDLSVWHGQSALVQGIDFSIARGGVMTLLGESGSGKSLLAQAIMGNLPASLHASGRIEIDGATTEAADAASRRRGWGRRVALLPQEPWLALDPTMTVAHQVAETYELVSRPAADSRHESLRGARRQARTLAGQALASLGLEAAADHYPFMISGGMAQRVAFLATHAAGAPLLIIDEPTKGLDADRRGEVLALLQRAQQQGMSLLCITHDVWLARALGGELAVMLEGRMVERGQAEALLARPGHAYTRRLLAADPACWPQPAATVSTASAPASSVLVELSQVAKSFGEQPLFSGISARLRAGEIVAVSGPSGVGKTTFGNIVLGLLRPDAGQVTRAAGLARTAFQKIYQDPAAAFAPTVTLRQSLRDLVRLHGLDWQPLEDLLARMRLCPSLLERLPRQVSGGELQRIALARVLLMRPALIFADEPTSRLDPLTQQEVIALLVEQAREAGSAVLLVTHDAQIVRCVADRRLLLGPPP
ncbi:ATP-binding cassette domain-containing protein [Herbaspirillum sp. C9C3]|uniref:ABC transporter ATP-binding protein n=1 Tax=Herbaspirillum sp. C9C3 TaxID=2735271 RepID=UPI001584BF46|nr:ATP-binding cassette domain-containing protein [Herbaspirillum sp. C9C3]NUT60574.1 ABC transporter ATP-binding protein [Herbaspirillum sp. C9C3]